MLLNPQASRVLSCDRERAGVAPCLWKTLAGLPAPPSMGENGAP